MVMCGCMVDTSLGAAANAHFLAATEWMGRVEQEAIGPLNLFNVHTTVNVTLKNDLSKNAVRYENGYLYPPDGPGLGVELNEEVAKRLATPGKKPVVI
jgi:L-alanine-DL-glutamate epimerase-like enolase superfamily enzyme